MDIEQSRQIKPSVKLEWIPFSAPSVAWVYFNGTSCEQGYKLAWEDHKAGKDLAEAYLEVSLRESLSNGMAQLKVCLALFKECKGGRDCRSRSSVYVRDDCDRWKCPACGSEHRV